MFIKKEWLPTIYFLFMVVMIILFSFVLYYMKLYGEEYSSDPLTFGARQLDLESCTCVASGDKSFTFNQTDVKQIIQRKTGSYFQGGKITPNWSFNVSN